MVSDITGEEEPREKGHSVCKREGGERIIGREREEREREREEGEFIESEKQGQK